jgi:hypothetical protein
VGAPNRAWSALVFRCAELSSTSVHARDRRDRYLLGYCFRLNLREPPRVNCSMDVGEADWVYSTNVCVGYYFRRVSRLFRFQGPQRDAHVTDLRTNYWLHVVGSERGPILDRNSDGNWHYLK